MCQNHRKGRTLENLEAHAEDHFSRSRRLFLQKMGVLAGGSMVLGPATLSAFAPSPLMAALAGGPSDRILVLIRLDGGNDGLNTIIQRGNDQYYNIRPTLAVQEADLWPLSADFGIPNWADGLQNLWQNGRMRVIHNVGYPDPNYSHFRSSDIWATASGAEDYWRTGWVGRFLDNEFPAFLDAPPTVPPALQIGVATNLLFQADQTAMALAISSPEEFAQIAATGELFSTAGLGPEPHDQELKYVRQTANAAFRYAETIQKAYSRGKNQAQYPTAGLLGEQLAIVARLIKGQLGTRIFMVSISGFDTHAYQADTHPLLLKDIGDSVKAFFDDLAAGGMQENVLGMTFSEFGRTIFENASVGTDHGTGGPILLFGPNLDQSFVGSPPDLTNADPGFDPAFSVDFRDVYATVLQDWLGTAPNVVDFSLGASHSKIAGLVPVAPAPVGSNADCALLGHNRSTTLPNAFDLKYSLSEGSNVRIQITDEAGHVLRTLVSEFRERGSHTFVFQPTAFFLPPGRYVYRLQSGGRVVSRAIKI